MAGNGRLPRVALIAGTLGLGGAEKQLVMMARALKAADTVVRVYSLTRGEHFEAALGALGLFPEWFGQHANPAVRLAALTTRLRSFGPDIVQSCHFFANLYAAGAGRALDALTIGAIRNDVYHELEENGRWGPWLLRAPHVHIANSEAARANAVAHGVEQQRLFVVSNAIDVAAFDQLAGAAAPETGEPTVIVVARLVAVKRIDRVLHALAVARRVTPTLRCMIVGEGPERARLEQLAAELGLAPHAVRFLGRRDDIPSLLRQATIFALSSAREGLPNTIIEAMAAGLPVVTTPAGDAARLVQDGVTGYVIPHDDIALYGQRLAALGRNPALCCSMGSAGRQAVIDHYSSEGLAMRLLQVYEQAGARWAKPVGYGAREVGR